MRGLGTVTASYIYVVDTAPAGCPSGSFKLRASSARLVVAGKGEIRLGFNDQEGCYVPGGAPNVTQSFTITGGSAIYAGASGSGRVERVAQFASAGAVGRDTWIGTLVVPGVEFDVTPPAFSGATSKTVRAPKSAKRVRVTYNVTASDASDGQIPVTCAPASGTRFPDRPHAGQLLGDRYEREHRDGEIQGHRSAPLTAHRLTPTPSLLEGVLPEAG